MSETQAALPEVSWPELAANALVGTDRRPVTDAGTGDPAAALLDAAAVATVRRRAGVNALTGVAAPDPAPAGGTLVPPPAAARLGAMLGKGGFDSSGEGLSRYEILIEWLSAVAAAGRVLPPTYLPDLLDLARRNTDMRGPLVAGAGSRASWLAAQNPAWQYLARTTEEPPPDEETGLAWWHEGTAGRRTGYLTTLRRSDPDRARELLAGDWAQLTHEERAALIAVLRIGLGPADEPFLEAALDDRRKEVRTTAAALLTGLPDSGYAQRCAARARAAVKLHRRKDRPSVLLVEVPAECDKAMRRDGVNPKPPQGVGERTWWLQEVVARAPLACWLTPTGGAEGYAATPAEFMAMSFADHDWAAPVRKGLLSATVDQADPDWAGALIEIAPRLGKKAEDRLAVESLYPVLRQADLAARAVRMLTTAEAHGVDDILEMCAAPWPDSLAEALLRYLGSGKRAGVSDWRRISICETAATRMPAHHAAAAAAIGARFRATGKDDYLASGLEQLAETLRFRHEMIEELA